MTGCAQVLGAYGFDGCGGFDDDEIGRRLQRPEPGDSAPSAGPAQVAEQGMQTMETLRRGAGRRGARSLWGWHINRACNAS
jgi:hypothetical protein